MGMTRQEIEQLYQKYGGMVFRRCQQLLQDEDNAMDAMQEVFAKLIKQRKVISDKGLSSLLYRMATNFCLNQIRHIKVTEDYASSHLSEGSEEEESSPDLEAQQMTEDMVRKILRRVPKKSREAAIYHFVDGFTMDEIATMMNMSNSNVRRLIRELKQLTTQWESTL